ncbi:MAG: NAD-dependent epimerase/dehydratase family protein [Ruminococcus sp.]|nr:NAD-dependent epimerase/dehydratase family protein [Ruminococcus sp.]MBO5164922.1 NAD-dependent epimerase/dehydratase family protein [Ruminococcus sp.]
MKALLIGGTGTISMAVTKLLAEKEWEVYLLNRGTQKRELPQGVNVINADINDEAAAAKKLDGMKFDAVCEFIGFVPEQLERDYRLFNGRTKQFMYISSASAYHKPVSDYIISERTTLANPYWEYSRNKIACEEFLMKMYRENGFPITIVRPSHTYDERSVPLGVHGRNGSWQVIKRMIEGKPVIIHGDGASLWTMTHNSDFAKGFVGLMGNIHAIGEAYQITSDETLTWNQIYGSIANALGVELVPYHVSSDFLCSVSDYDFKGSLIGDKANSVVFDNEKLKRAVPDFKAEVRFDEGIRRTIEYILRHPEYQISDPEFDLWCDKVIAAIEKTKKEIFN